MNLSKAARKVEKQVLRISKKVLDGRRFESFDADLLTVGEGDIDDHSDAQAAGQAYYGMLTLLARKALRDAETAFDNWHAKVYNKCNELIKSETGIKRPNKVDVENRVAQEYKEKYKKYRKIINKKLYVYERLNIWYSAWEKKSFSLSNLKEGKFRPDGRDTRSLVGRSAEDVEE